MNSQPSRKILIVDDEANVLNALRRSLRKEGYEVFTASSPSEALTLLSTNPVDVVISDHLMPEMTGLEFLNIIRNRYPDMMRLMLTGHADMQTAIHAINQGEIYRFLTKPWDDADIKVTLFLAFEHLELQREHRRLLAMVRSQREFIESLERNHPGISTIQRDETGAIIIMDEQYAA
jgi:two-component system, probable response regulator PhcQ